MKRLLLFFILTALFISSNVSIAGGNKLFVGSLSWSTKKSDLKKYFLHMVKLKK